MSPPVSPICQKSILFFRFLLMQDIAVLSVLGVRIVLLIATAEQVDATLRQMGETPKYCDGHRISDPVSMRVAQQVSGFARSHVEAALSRGRANAELGRGVGVDVVGSNMFFTAQPVGVRAGIDYGHTGEVRRIEGICFRPPTHFSHMSHPTFPRPHL